MIAATGKGLYQPGESFLHRLDPRVKVVATLIMVALNFAATSWWQVLVVAAILTVIISNLGTDAKPLGRMLWFLRWLLLFTILLHLFFTPGRTLWGLSWLSYDGFLVGCFVCAQLMAAVLFASSMALTTSVEQLVGAFGWLVRPLSLLGVNTANWERLSLLALNFIPVVRDQMARVSEGEKHSEDHNQQSCTGRWASWTFRLNSLVKELVDHGDEVAHELAAEGEQPSLSAKLPPLFPMAFADQLLLLSLVAVLCGYGLVKLL